MTETLTVELPEQSIDASPAAEHLRANCGGASPAS
jgi:hypothetical protein